MLTRRAFLSALAAVPFVGKLIPQDTITRADTLAGFRHLKFHPRAFSFTMKPMGCVEFSEVFNPDAWEPMTFEDKPILLGDSFVRGEDGQFHRPRLTFAEWDRLHQV